MLTRPIVFKITPFDATTEYIVRFNAMGGDQIFGSNVVIRNNNDNSIVYNKTIDSFKFEHVIPANTIKNGQSYNIKIRTKNRSNEFSEFSDPVLFQCYSNAVINCDNIIDNTVNNQTYLFHFTYSQAENINVQSYKVLLYDEHEILISESEAIKTTINVLQYEFASLQNNKKYYIECKVLNQAEMDSTSNKVQFIAKYAEPRVKHTIKLTNYAENASINVDAKVIQVFFKKLDGNISFEGNECINLKTGSIYTDYENGLDLKGNWTLKMYVKGLEENKKIVKIIFENTLITLLMYDNRIHLYKEFKEIEDYRMHLASNKLDNININDTLCIWMQNVDGSNNIKIEKYLT